jgi:hypothetical protein
MIALSLIGTLSFAQQKEVARNETTGSNQIVLAENAVAADSAFISVPKGSLVIDSDLERRLEEKIRNSAVRVHYPDNSPFKDLAILIPIFGIIFGTLLPVAIIFIIFLFRHRDKKARYRLAEQAIANGQPLPENLFVKIEAEKGNLFNRGVNNTCIGVGLFIFLWGISKEFGVGCIGLLVMFTGLGQVIIYNHQRQRAKENPPTLSGNEPAETPRNAAE